MNAIKKLLFTFDYQNGGLLFYRIVLGLSMMFHGYLKFAGGEKMLYGVGHMLAGFGISGGYLALGTMAATAEMLGGLLIILGLFSRLGSLLVIGTLFVATMVDLSHGFFKWDYPSQMMFGALMLLIVGPGRYSFDWKHRN